MLQQRSVQLGAKSPRLLAPSSTATATPSFAKAHRERNAARPSQGRGARALPQISAQCTAQRGGTDVIGAIGTAPDARSSCSPETRNHHNHLDNGIDNRFSNILSRRSALLRLASARAAAGLAAAAAAAAFVGPAGRAAALPLGPLGPVKRVGGDKRTGLTAEEVAAVLRRDLAEGQYFVTGDLTREVFADDCRFIDPTNDVTGLSKYLTALGVLFDPQYSKVELLDIRVTDPRVIEADWRLGGYLVFPWNPRVEPFTGHTVYTLNEEGLVSEQRQSWSISGATALVESFTPTWAPRRQLF